MAINFAIRGTVLCHCLAQKFFTDRFDRDLDTFLRSNFASSSLTKWAQLMSYGASFVFSVAAACFVVVQADPSDQSRVALALNYAFNLPYFLMFFGCIVNNIKVALTALERLMDLLERLMDLLGTSHKSRHGTQSSIHPCLTDPACHRS